MLYIAAVFLPLLGCLLAGLIGQYLNGVWRLVPAGAAGHGHDAHGHDDHAHAHTHGDHGQDDHGHGHDHAPQPGDRFAQMITVLCMAVAALCGVLAFFDVAYAGHARTVTLFTFIDSGSLEVSWALRYDTLSAVMVGMVTVVSTLIHVYSVGYMAHDKTVPRFMAYLSLFTFAMLMLVTADNLVQLFFGWEGVGLASYLLIGYWYERPSAGAAAIKAFLVNRVGDLGFALGIAGVFLLFGSVEFSTIFAAVAEHRDAVVNIAGIEMRTLELLCVLLFIGAMGKSAQLGLHTWLPDAMEGPTPVSALIHAATMVTAGVFMVARLSPLFEYAPNALALVTLVGAATAFFAATVGCVQNDIKRVIAYSTCSQLGYMFFAAGVSAYPAAIFHLFTHAFFKALLFLGAGSVIHAMSDEQDIRRMGGIWRKVPITYTVMWIGSLALAGIPLFAGYYSKDMVLEAAWASHTAHGRIAYFLGIAAAFMTAFYSWRLLLLTFHGTPRADKHVMDHVHESPLVMTVPLMLLAAGAVFAGMAFYESFVGHHFAEFWREAIFIAPEHHAMHDAHDVATWVKKLPLVCALSGIALAYVFYLLRPELPGLIAARFQGLYRFLLNKWYFDELYDAIFVRPSMALGRVLWKGGDGAVIDGLGPDGVAAATRAVAARAVRAQTGFVYHYAFVMLAGLVALVTLWFMLRAG
ncbi:MAG: NADH-quinone oxidoreductase subunit L [Alphaproteobacteria bacterium]|nr:NADH-quinone oxidoreductase subunit L [Alphaproteobacteria bacterium]